MATINEDYVSYGVAQLLKEKGFNWDCITYYVDSEPDNVKYSMLFENNTTWEERCYSAPTHQMTIKWLREERNIFIVIDPHAYDYINEKNSSYVFSLWQGDNYYENPLLKDFPSYKETVEAAIKYCLKNWI